MSVSRCEHCGRMFEARPDQVGGIINCPACGKATAVEGLNDPLYRVLVALALAFAVAVGVVIGLTVSPYLGVVVGAAVIGLFYVLRSVL